MCVCVHGSFTILNSLSEGSSGNCNIVEVQLVNSDDGKVNAYFGIVEVCGAGSPNEWNVICADRQAINDGVSNAVCRQMGFIGATESKQVK